jgi:hypothetical protein
MNIIPSRPKLNHINRQLTEPDALALQPWITPDDLADDIERLIGILVTPYVISALQKASQPKL